MAGGTGEDVGGNARLLEALKHEQGWLVKWILQQDDAAVLQPLLDERDAEGCLPLHYAAKAGVSETRGKAGSEDDMMINCVQAKA